MKYKAMSILGFNRGTRYKSNSNRSEKEGKNPRNRNRPRPYVEVVRSPLTQPTSSPKGKNKEMQKEVIRGKTTSSSTNQHVN